MGQKVSPVGLRIGVNKSWQSNWYAEGKDFAKNLASDHKIRTFLEKKLASAAVASIVIERNQNKPKLLLIPLNLVL